VTEENQTRSAAGSHSPPPLDGTTPPAQPGSQRPALRSTRAQKQKQRSLVTALIVLLLLACALGACVATYIVLGNSSKKDKITQAESHYTAAETAVGAAESAIESATAAGDPTQMTSGIAKATKSLRSARDEVASAKASAEQLKESQGRTDYLASLAAATQALDGLENLIGYLDTASGMMSKADEAGVVAKQANSDLADAVALGNKGSYTKMRAKASAASEGYSKAAILFEEADKLDPTAELAKVATYARKRKEQADTLIRMADEGKAGKFSAYNADIKNQEALDKAAMAAGTPAILSDANWADKRLEAIRTTIVADAERADALRKTALEELGYKN